MRIFIIGLLFTIVSCSKQSALSLPNPPEGWVVIKSNDESNYSYLATDISEHKNQYGNFVHFWVLINTIEHTEKMPSESSSKSKFIIRCNDKNIRSERQITYSKFNGDGSIISDSGEDLITSRMKEIVPQSLGDDFYKLLCKKNISK
jgi:hypothetical protein